MADSVDALVVHHESASRFAITIDGHLAQLQYKRRPGQIAFVHSEVPKELEGKGLASQLARAALDFARANKLEVLPYCPFVAAYLRKHSEDLDLVPDAYRHLVTGSQS